MSTPVHPSSAPDLPQAVQTALATPRGVTVLRSPPGAGKTRETLTQLLLGITAGRWARVLIAVRDTADETSLAAQLVRRVAELADDLRLPDRAWTRVVYGHVALGRRFPADTADELERRYAAQFEWTTPLAIISHAHIPLLGQPRGAGPLKVLRQAELLLVDEDPHAALMSSEQDLLTAGMQPVSISGLMSALHTAGLVDAGLNARVVQRRSWWTQPRTLRLVRLTWEEHIPAQPLVRVDHPFVRVTRHRAWGNQVLRRSLAAADLGVMLRSARGPRADDPHAWAQLERRVRRLLDPHNGSPVVARRYARIVQQLLRGLMEPDGGTHDTVGVQWPGDEAAEGVLRWNVRRPLSLPMPVVILDAYAHPTLYQAVFAPAPVNLIHVPTTRPLRVMAAPVLARDATDLIKQRGAARLGLIAQELAQFAGEARLGTLFVMAQVHQRGWYGQVLREALEARGVTPDRFAFRYWGAGRGSNDHEGWDVVALTPPILPGTYARHDLAPLELPENLRDDLRHHAQTAELLQMLHRGRQAWFGSRTLMTFLPCVLCPVSRESRCTTTTAPVAQLCTHWTPWGVKVQPFQPTIHHAFGARKPTWREKARRVAEEVLASGAGVPLMVFEAVGLTRVTGGTARRWMDLERMATHLWDTSSSRTAWQELRDTVDWRRAAGETPEAWRQRIEEAWRAVGVEPAHDTSRRAECDVLTELGLREFEVLVGGRKWRAFAKRHQSAERAVRAALGWP